MRAQWFVTTFFLAATWFLAANLVQAQSDTAALIQKARESFQPVTAEQVAAARAEVATRMGELERFVKPSSANGQKWLTFLKWDALREQLAADGGPSLESLDATLAQLTRDEVGLELRRFRNLADALRQYRDRLAVSQWQGPAAIYGQQLDALSQSLEQFRSEPTSANELALSNQLSVIDAIGQAPELVATVRREYARPNAFIDVSAGLLKAAAEPIDRSEPITDNILGTSIDGTAHTIGQVEIRPQPSENSAALELVSTGQSTTQNVGRNGPAVIRSTGHTDFTATKRVELTDAAFSSQPAHADATNNTDIHSISKRGGGMGSRMVSKIGWQRAGESKSQANAIAADHAEDRIERSFNKEVNQKLSDARERYEDEYIHPLARRGEVPEHIRFSSTGEAVSLEVTQAGRNQLAAPTAPPAGLVGRDITMRLHESAVNNYSALVLGGATAGEDEPGQETKFDVKMPNWLKNVWEERTAEGRQEAAAAGGEFKPWSLKFRPGRPLSVEFDGDKVKLTLHIARLESGESDPFTNWDVWGTFAPEHKEGVVVLRREGDLDAMPTNLQGELGSRRAAQRNNLLKEFNSRSAQGRGFPSKIDFPEFKAEGALANAGPLQLKEILSSGGWLTLVWDRAGADHENPPTSGAGG